MKCANIFNLGLAFKIIGIRFDPMVQTGSQFGRWLYFCCSQVFSQNGGGGTVLGSDIDKRCLGTGIRVMVDDDMRVQLSHLFIMVWLGIHDHNPAELIYLNLFKRNHDDVQ